MSLPAYNQRLPLMPIYSVCYSSASWYYLSLKVCTTIPSQNQLFLLRNYRLGTKNCAKALQSFQKLLSSSQTFRSGRRRQLRYHLNHLLLSPQRYLQQIVNSSGCSLLESGCSGRVVFFSIGTTSILERALQNTYTHLILDFGLIWHHSSKISSKLGLQKIATHWSLKDRGLKNKSTSIDSHQSNMCWL